MIISKEGLKSKNMISYNLESEFIEKIIDLLDVDEPEHDRGFNKYKTIRSCQHWVLFKSGDEGFLETYMEGPEILYLQEKLGKPISKHFQEYIYHPIYLELNNFRPPSLLENLNLLT